MTETPRCPLTYRGPALLVNGPCAMSKTPFLGLRDNCLCSCRGGTPEVNLPVSRPTSSP